MAGWPSTTMGSHDVVWVTSSVAAKTNTPCEACGGWGPPDIGLLRTLKASTPPPARRTGKGAEGLRKLYEGFSRQASGTMPAGQSDAVPNGPNLITLGQEVAAFRDHGVITKSASLGDTGRHEGEPRSAKVLIRQHAMDRTTLDVMTAA